jgi:hypothetical protein
VKEAGTGAYQGTFGYGINPEGEINGFYYDTSVSHGFLRSPDGAITTFDAPDAVTAPSLLVSTRGGRLSETSPPQTIWSMGSYAGRMARLHHPSQTEMRALPAPSKVVMELRFLTLTYLEPSQDNTMMRTLWGIRS